MMKIYRIENTKHHGMWYNNQAKPTPSIKKSQEYPMEYSERFRKNGKVWLSAAKSIENLREWFSADDARELGDAGFVLLEIEAKEFVVEDNQVLLVRDGAVERELPFEAVWEEL